MMLQFTYIREVRVLRFKRSYWVGEGERQRDRKGYIYRERGSVCVEREIEQGVERKKKKIERQRERERKKKEREREKFRIRFVRPLIQHHRKFHKYVSLFYNL